MTDSTKIWRRSRGAGQYEQSLRRVADTYLRCRDYAGAVAALIDETNVAYPAASAALAEVSYQRLFWLHYYNQLLGVLPSVDLTSPELLRTLSDPQRERIRELQEPAIEGIKIANARMTMVDGTISPDVLTNVDLIVPAVLPPGRYECDGWQVDIYRISDPWDDPNFRVLHQQSVTLLGMPLAVLSPALDRNKPLSGCVLRFPSPFHPGIMVGPNGEPEFENRDIREALFGPDYDPFVSKAGELLIKIAGEGWPSQQELIAAIKDMDSYAVGYRTAGEVVTFNFFQPLVELSVFIKTRDRFVQRFKRAVDSGIPRESAKSLAFQDPITDNSLLRLYTASVLNALVAKPSETGDWWKTVWIDDGTYTKVRKEPDVGRDIFHIISPWFAVHGLRLIRQSDAASGNIDYLVSGGYAGKTLTCGIELKYAHHAHLLDGIGVQLPAYLADLATNDGVFVAVWCKGGKFGKPIAYTDIQELEEALVKQVPEPLSIDVVCVPAQFREAPSRMRIGG